MLSRVKLDEALDDADEAIRLAPACPDGFEVRAGVWNWRHEYDKAIADMDQAIRLDPTDADSYYQRGYSWARKHEDEKALADFNEAVRRDPKSEPALIVPSPILPAGASTR